MPTYSNGCLHVDERAPVEQAAPLEQPACVAISRGAAGDLPKDSWCRPFTRTASSTTSLTQTPHGGVRFGLITYINVSTNRHMSNLHTTSRASSSMRAALDQHMIQTSRRLPQLSPTYWIAAAFDVGNVYLTQPTTNFSNNHYSYMYLEQKCPAMHRETCYIS